MKAQLTIFQNANGPLSKTYQIKNGKLERSTSAQMTGGSYYCLEIDSLFEIMNASAAGLVGPELAYCYGVPRPGAPLSGVVTTAEHDGAGGSMARTSSNFVWAAGRPGVMMFDFDPAPDGRCAGWKGEDYLEQLFSVAPELADAEIVLTPSSSSRVWMDGRPVGGGWRAYALADRAEMIPAYGEAILSRLVMAGHGWVTISASGARLLRAAVDGSVWQSNRLDFVGQPVAGEGLEVMEGAALLEGEQGGLLTMTNLAPEGWRSSGAVQDMMAKAEGEAASVAAAWENERVAAAVAAGASEAEARELWGKARTGVLDGAFVLYDRQGRGVTVREILADPQRWHGQGVRHPLEPETGGSDYTKLYLVGQRAFPMLTSRAHGGQEWRLVDYTASEVMGTVDWTQYCIAVMDDPIAYEQAIIEASVRLGVSKSAVRKSIKQALRAVPDNRVLLSKAAPDDSAAIFCATQAKTLICADDEFMEWEAGAYRVVSKQELLSRIHAMLQNAIVETDAGRVPFNPTSADRSEILDALRVRTHISGADRPHWLSSGLEAPGVMSFPNGYYDLRTGSFNPPTPDLFTRCAVDFPYVPDAPRPERWLRFLRQLFSNQDEIDLLQRMFGYVLSGATHLQVIFMITGPSRGGKGVLTQTLQALMGRENCVSLSLDDLDGSSAFGMQKLIGRSLATATDVHVSPKANKERIAETLKAISGEDDVSIGRKHISDWRGRLGVRFWLTANTVPDLPDVSRGLANRLVMLRLRQSFKGRETPQLFEKELSPELPGIMAWALDGLRALEREGRFNPPESSMEAREDFELGNNPVLAFLADKCVVDGEAKTAKIEVRTAYRLWAADNGERPMKDRELDRHLRSAGVQMSRTGMIKVKVDGKTMHAYQGISLKS